ERTDWRRRLRLFYLTGLRDEVDSDVAGPLRPALADGLEESSDEAVAWVVSEDTGTVETWTKAARRGLEETGGSEVMRFLFPLLTARLGALPEPVRACEALREVLAGLEEELDLSPAARERFREEVKRLLERSREADWLLPFRRSIVPWLWRWAAEKEKVTVRDELIRSLEHWKDRLEEILETAKALAPASQSPEYLALSLGAEAVRWVDPVHMGSALQKIRGGSQGVAEEKRKRVEGLVRELCQALEWLQAQPLVEWIARRPMPGQSEALCRVFPKSDGFTEASERIGECLRYGQEIERLRRFAQLEVEGSYDPALHGMLLERWRWPWVSPEVMGALPTVVVMLDNWEASGDSLSALLTVLRREYPIQVCLLEEWSASKILEAHEAGGGVGDPAWLMLACPEARIVRTSLLRPDESLRVVREGLRVDRPVLTVISCPPEEGSRQVVWEMGQVAWRARVTPTWICDPSGGDSWADRFHLLENPAPSSLSTSVHWREKDDAEGETEADEVCVFAHLAAWDLELRREFWELPAELELDELTLVGAYFKSEAEEDAIPFIWVRGRDGAVRRAVLTRRLLKASAGFLCSWRLVQELSGHNNSHVRQAVARVEEELARRFDREKEAALTGARREGAEEVIGRLVGILTNLPQGGVEIPTVASMVTSRAMFESRSSETGAEVASTQEAVSEEVLSEAIVEEPITEEAYIDSDLCTSCNDCISLNPRMFKYNKERQAYLADRSAGTFAELVKAAEKCPARCIHPGSPRPGDPTVTPELLERAKVFR
ncbi:MAG TPA: ferredoxin, partial [Acidobacteriota bacterium]|nr:ferredoxin [Acidobacteriota bacterium]